MPRRLWAVFAVIAAVTGCGGSQAGDPALRGITSVLLERHGKVVIERYYQGTRPSDRLPIFSITKSVTSALVGMAIADGRLSGVDERLPWRRQVTVGQLLSMTAGYAPSVSFKRTDPESLADRPLLNRPGTFAYDSGSMDLLADLIARATGMPAAAYARRRLFGPMGITAERWPGSRGSSGLLLRPRDLLAFGQLYLDGGVWHGKRIVPARWIRMSTRAHAVVRRGLHYGFGWWIRSGSYAGYGYLGQVLAVFPGRDEVVLVTSSREDADPLALVRRLTRG
ncbi:MAG: serine hydrolase domain-containing protein [Gaiellaceae bacterium]|jgi:CubicO group peptidase (beta-lactamase class C family)